MNEIDRRPVLWQWQHVIGLLTFMALLTFGALECVDRLNRHPEAATPPPTTMPPAPHLSEAPSEVPSNTAPAPRDSAFNAVVSSFIAFGLLASAVFAVMPPFAFYTKTKSGWLAVLTLRRLGRFWPTCAQVAERATEEGRSEGHVSGWTMALAEFYWVAGLMVIAWGVVASMAIVGAAMYLLVTLIGVV